MIDDTSLRGFFDELTKISSSLGHEIKKYMAYSLGGAAAGGASGAIIGQPGQKMKERALTGALAGAIGGPLSLGVREVALREGLIKALKRAK